MNHTLLLKYPASWWGAKWREALPSGNGQLGAAVYGAVQQETVMLTHADLWWKGTIEPLPDISDQLPEVRRLLQADQALQADKVLSQTLKDRGYAPQMASPLPLGDLKLTMKADQAFKNYRKSLNMDTGEISVQWDAASIHYVRKLFVSRCDDMIVYEISSDSPQAIEAQITIDLHDRSDTKRSFNRPSSILPDGLEVYTEGEYIYYAARHEDGSDFGAVARVIAENAEVTCSQDQIHISKGNKLLILLRMFVYGKREQDWKDLKQALQQTNKSYDEWLEPHAEMHGQLFNRVTLDLNATDRDRSNEELLLDAYQGEASLSLTEKMWAYGRYLLISSTREGSQPCHLYGLWCGEYQGVWAFHMVNENLQMIYWQALSGNMPELMLPVFDYFEQKLDDFRMNARNLYGCRGIYVPAATTPDTGLLKILAPHIIHWTGGAGWLAQHYYDYYLHTGDTHFLETRALPFLREVAQFYEDFFVIDEKGMFMSYPSNSPENSPGNYWNGNGMGAAMETTINATMDFAIAREVLTHLIEGSKITKRCKDETAKWEAMLERIPPYEINEDGAIKEWMHPYFTDNYHHRHQSHIYPVFPGTEVTRSNQPELYEAFVTAVKKRLTIGLNEQTGWSFMHMANNYARMGEGDLALECLDLLSRSCMNAIFKTYHNDWRNMGVGVNMDWAPVQIDANMGWTAAIQEMLMFSVIGEIHLLPALPKRWRKGKIENMLARGGIQVSIEWDQDEGSANITLCSIDRDQEIQLRPYGIISLEMNKVQTYSIHLESSKG